MSPWQVIARREFRAVTGGWPYRVVTVVGALLLAALAWTPVLIAPLTGPSVGDGSPARILVAAPWELFQALEGQAAPRASGAALQLEWIGSELDRAGQTTADARVQDAEIDGWLELVPGPEGLQASLTLATTQRALEPLLRQLVAPVVWTGRARALGVAPEVVAALQQPVPLEVRLLPRVGADPVPRAVREAVSPLLLVGLVMAITLYGNAISMGIIQEKESRVAELLVGAVPPTQILVGKVVGIGGAGLLQVLVWMLVGFLVSGPRLVAAIGRWLGLEELAFSPGILPAPILAAFTLFFLLGYTLYALVYAAFASTVARAEEVNQALTLPFFLILLGFAIALGAWVAPASSLAVAGSLIPCFTPFVLFARLVTGSVPLGQLAAGVGLTLVAIILAARFAGHAYRRNVLRDRRVSLRELFTGREPGRRQNPD